MARGIWKGAISFGLVNVPVERFSAGSKRCNKATGAEVPWGEIVKRHKYEDAKYFVLSDEDFRRANAEAAKTVDIQAFVDLKDIPPLFIENPYYLAPGRRGERARHEEKR